MSDIDKAWDAPPAQLEVDGMTYDVTPEAAALRSLFDTSAFRYIGNAGIASWSDEQIDAVHAVQEHIAGNYLFARDALGDGSARSVQVKFRQFMMLRDQLIAADVCLACGCHPHGRRCQCENDE